MRRGGCRASSTARSRCSRARRRPCSPSGSRTSATRARSGSSARLDEATDALEQRRDERLAALDGHIAELEADIRRRLEELGADAEAERAVIEARLQELVRRVGSLDALQST